MDGTTRIHLTVALSLLCALAGCGAVPADRPNIVWISLEDITPMLGSYGDQYARTPFSGQSGGGGHPLREGLRCVPGLLSVKVQHHHGNVSEFAGKHASQGAVPDDRNSRRCFRTCCARPGITQATTGSAITTWQEMNGTRAVVKPTGGIDRTRVRHSSQSSISQSAIPASRKSRKTKSSSGDCLDSSRRISTMRRRPPSPRITLTCRCSAGLGRDTTTRSRR